jgi:hypothetical protein
LTALVLYLHGSYHNALAIFLIPAILCLVTLAIARIEYPRPQELEQNEPKPLASKGFSRAYRPSFPDSAE